MTIIADLQTEFMINFQYYYWEGIKRVAVHRKKQVKNVENEFDVIFLGDDWVSRGGFHVNSTRFYSNLLAWLKFACVNDI